MLIAKHVFAILLATYTHIYLIKIKFMINSDIIVVIIYDDDSDDDGVILISSQITYQ